MRLDKFLSHNGFGSRQEVKKIIKDKRVMINEKIVTQASQHVDLSNDIVKVNDTLIDYSPSIYYMLNKPSGYICSHNSEMYPSVLELIHDFRTDLIIVGRLDVDTEGLLLITNDGQFSHRVSHGKKEVYKTYHVKLLNDFDLSYIPILKKGIKLDNWDLKPAKVKVINSKSIYLSIAEGKYHQVKRMMHYCDNEVTYLKRIQIGNLDLDPKLDIGDYRELSEQEILKF